MDKIDLEKERVSVDDFFGAESIHCMTSYIRKLPTITRTIEHKRPFRPEVDFKQLATTARLRAPPRLAPAPRVPSALLK